MPYKYIGRTTDFKGKTLWEILGNLKNFGAGRIVARNMLQRYPEPCYMKVMKVEALPDPNVQDYDSKRKVIALVEKTFRGVKADKLVQMESATYKSDYFLVPKHKEAEFCKPVAPREIKILANKMEYPPLVKEYIMRQMKASGVPVTQEPKMTIVYNRSSESLKSYRVAEGDEKPTVPEPSIGLGTPVSPRLYENISAK